VCGNISVKCAAAQPRSLEGTLVADKVAPSQATRSFPACGRPSVRPYQFIIANEACNGPSNRRVTKIQFMIHLASDLEHVCTRSTVALLLALYAPCCSVFVVTSDKRGRALCSGGTASDIWICKAFRGRAVVYLNSTTGGMVKRRQQSMEATESEDVSRVTEHLLCGRW
jgi:hypothetical protein